MTLKWTTMLYSVDRVKTCKILKQTICTHWVLNTPTILLHRHVSAQLGHYQRVRYRIASRSTKRLQIWHVKMT
jgi:hypothetical protein